MDKVIKWLKSMQFAKLMCALLTFSAIGIFIWGFFVPPLGTIDGSVLKAGGILLGFAALWVIAHIAIEMDKAARLKIGNTEFEVKDED